MPEPPPASSRRFPLWETVAIFLAIASLWPAYILKWEGPGWRVLSYVMLAVMAAVFVRRLLAFERLKDEADTRRQRAAGEQGRTRLPWEPPTGAP
ncbi:MAG TPA: hypothetical protein PLE19_11595 [Planctomycetota bacterium]|nr:hypothetical protein [Planctomycetota bacterium]HRR78756.1 hypothetical protein [Planctomycetota bacterium]HRT95231.1 hypothetical protein [Planctomycetota bacterium]